MYDKDSFIFMTHYLRLSFKYKNNELWETDQENEKMTKKNIKPDKKTGQENIKIDQVYDKDFLTKKGYKKIMILEFCKTPRTLKEIMEYINLNHRETFMLNYLKPLLKDGKLAMTIPEQPKNRNQKYITINKRRNEYDK